jgi:hypothetical protein
LLKNPQTENICVSLDGDSLNPNGEVSGGNPKIISEALEFEIMYNFIVPQEP